MNSTIITENRGSSSSPLSVPPQLRNDISTSLSQGAETLAEMSRDLSQNSFSSANLQRLREQLEKLQESSERLSASADILAAQPDLRAYFVALAELASKHDNKAPYREVTSDHPDFDRASIPYYRSRLLSLGLVEITGRQDGDFMKLGITELGRVLLPSVRETLA